MEMVIREFLLITYLQISIGFSVGNTKLLFPPSIGSDSSQMTSKTNLVNAETNIPISNLNNLIAVTKSTSRVHKQRLMIPTVVKISNNERLLNWISARTRAPSTGKLRINDGQISHSKGITGSVLRLQNGGAISSDDAGTNVFISNEKKDWDSVIVEDNSDNLNAKSGRFDDLDITYQNNHNSEVTDKNVDDLENLNQEKTMLLSEHIRIKRATNGTAAESTAFMDDPNKVAMFIVLPLIIFVYGGCICIYCVHKCQDYVERVEPLKTIKHKVFGVPPEPPEPHSRQWMQRVMRRPRPTSSRSLPDPARTEPKEFDRRSVLSDAGICYFRDTTKDSAFSDMDIDSGVHSEGSRANEKVIYLNAESPDVHNINDYTVELKHVETTEIAVQTDDIQIVTISSSDMGVRTCEAGTSMYEKPPPRKTKKKNSDVGSRYLSWLKSARELREVLNKNTEPRTLHQMLQIATEEQKREEATAFDSEVQNIKKAETKKAPPKRQTGSPIISVEPYQNDSSYTSIHKKRANLLKHHGSLRGTSNAVTPVETRYTSASTSSSHGTDSPTGEAPPPYYRLGDTYMSKYKKKSKAAKEPEKSGEASKYVGINNSDTDSLM
ncbi:uncharacterized protein [Argopecten irradians]|uniref:uncharacterized protein n=1 Tax=Argopecten irradians TaxID=31199 RepID=UPI003717D34F